MYFKYNFHFGNDWEITAGLEDGFSQVSKKSRDDRQLHAINFPIDITFKSTNPSGWPQLIIQAYGWDGLGHEVVYGYGACHLPTVPGRHTRKVAMFIPESSSSLQAFVAATSGSRPEFVDPRVVAGSEGREVTRVSTQGIVTVVFNVVTKDLKRLSYQTGTNYAAQAATNDY